MKLFQELSLIESDLSAKKEAAHVINVINTLYSEWKKLGRRKNAVDIITTTANKLSTIDPTTLDAVHDAAKLKLSSLILRCFDIPYWKNVSQKEKLYKKLFPVIKKMETSNPSVTSGGNLREVIMTRLSASIAYNSDNKHIFVAYEPKISDTYLRYLFGKEPPTKTYRMQALMLPSEFESLIDILMANHAKAITKYTQLTSTDVKN